MTAQTSTIDQRLLRRIADAVPALIALYSIQSGRYIYVNKAVSWMLGYTPEQFINGGVPFVTSLVHPKDLPRVMGKNQEALEEANRRHGGDEIIASFEYRMRHLDGDWRWVHTDGTVFGRTTQGEVELILNVTLDITAQKKTERQLARSLKALESTLAVSD